MALAIPSLKLSPKDQIRVVQLPGDMEQDSVLACTAAVLSTLRASPRNHLTAIEVVLSVFSWNLEGFRSILDNGKSYTLVPRRPTKDQFLSWLGMGEGSNLTAEQIPISLPTSPAPDSFAITDFTSIYIILACLLMAIGKQPSNRAEEASLKRRPDALIRRFQMAENAQELLPGRRMGPSRDSLELIYGAFGNFVEIRNKVIKYFLAVQLGNEFYDVRMEIMMTNFNLMRGAGMTHVGAVLQLVQMHPWVIKVPELEPYFKKFVKELGEFEQVSPEVRPYHRLLVPQSQYLFVSSEYRPLIAVAGAFIEEVEQTFKGYVYGRDEHSALIESVKARAPGYSPGPGMSQLAQLLGVPDVSLPQVQGPTKDSAEEVV